MARATHALGTQLKLAAGYSYQWSGEYTFQQSVDRRLELVVAIVFFITGAVLRLRPKLMTGVAVLASLIPILASSGIGSDVMKPIAAPIVGSMATSCMNVLILVPLLYYMLKQRQERRTPPPEREKSPA